MFTSGLIWALASFCLCLSAWLKLKKSVVRLLVSGLLEKKSGSGLLEMILGSGLLDRKSGCSKSVCCSWLDGWWSDITGSSDNNDSSRFVKKIYMNIVNISKIEIKASVLTLNCEPTTNWST